MGDISLMFRHYSHKIYLYLAICASMATLVFGDTIFMKNGKSVEGRILKEDDNSITFLTPTMSINILRSNIARIERQATLSQNEVLGDIALEDKRYDEALSYYQAALKTGQNTESIRKKIASIQKIQEEEVTRRFGQQIKQAERLMDLKDFDSAEKLLNQILATIPNAALAKPVKDKIAHLYYRRALEYKNVVDDLKALDALKSAISISDGAYEAYLMYADILSGSTKNNMQAIDNYLRGLEAGDNNLTKEEKARYRRKVATLMEQEKNYADAIKQHKKVLELDPINYPDTKQKIIEDYLNLAAQAPPTEYGKRLELLNAALETDPYSTNARFAIVLLYYDNNHIDDAVKQCIELNNMNSKITDVHYYLGMCYLRQKKYEDARDAFERELLLNPNNYDALCAMGDYYLNGGKYDQAITYYDKARELSKEKYRAYLGLTRAYKKLEKPEKAREYLDQVFLTNPDHIEATILSGALYKDAKDYVKARSLFDNVVQRLTEGGHLNMTENMTLLIEALNQRGELNLILDSPRIALADFNEALKYQPDCAESYYLIAQAHSKMGNFKDAEDNFLTAQKLEPKNPNYYLGLGIMYHTKLKETKKAIVEYTKYIELGGEDFEKVNDWIKECGGKPVAPKIQ